MSQVKILLVQLASFGDCLFVTTIARQIKKIDYPGCHLTWMIGSKYTAVIHNNPYVDEIIEIPINSIYEIQQQRDLINKHVENYGGQEIFNEIFITDYTDENFQFWYGTTRSSLFRCYPHRIKIDPQPLIFLDGSEIENVAQFIYRNNISNDTFNILFECSPLSGQSIMTFEKARDIASEISSVKKNVRFILSSNQSFRSDNPNIVDGSVISIRENAELVNFCDLLIGCSSGISWICTSNHSRRIQTIQVINPSYTGGLFSASVRDDFRYFGLETDHLVELHNPQDSIIKDCISLAVDGNFKKVRKKYNAKDNSFFLDSRLCKEARIKIYEKVHYSLLIYVHKNSRVVLKIYKKVKPGWFTPKAWIMNMKYKIYGNSAI